MATNNHTVPSWMSDVKEDTIKTNVIQFVIKFFYLTYVIKLKLGME